MATPPFDRLPRYDELTGVLHELADEHPDLVSLESIGRSHEGRELWLATVTNSATGPADEKPAVWIDGNIHATEITGSVAALHLLHTLVTGHGADPEVTAALDTRTFYVLPRVNPDGAELALADQPTYLRSSTRAWPRTDEADGLVEEDADGDGRILTMRVPDANGSWEVCEADPRLLVPRRPGATGPGPYYRLLPEGTIRNYDGVTLKIARENRSLDLNRNFPAGWRTHGEQSGAGPFPTSEPEVRTVVQAVAERPNVCCYFAYHTFSGVILRPYDDRADDQMPTADLRLFKALGKAGTEITGYKCVSVYHDFRYDPKDVITGSADSWAYDHLGVFAFTTEFWSPIQKAGITDYHFIEWFDEHPVEDDLALLRWNDEQLGGRGYVDWYPFEHPELGPVELGGWDWFRFWTNPPPEFLEAEVAPHSRFALACALSSPRLALHTAGATRLGEEAWRVRLVVQNEGWLPTNVTEKANERKVVRRLQAEIEVPEGATLEPGTPRLVDLDQLSGWSRAKTMMSWDPHADATTDRAKVEWIVRAAPGTVVRLTARHPRAGVVRTEVTLR